MLNAPNPAWVLLGTLLLWLPTLRNLLAGNLNVTAGIVRFGLSLAVSWLGCELLRRVIRAYAHSNAGRRSADPEATTDAGHDGKPRGRRRPRPRPRPQSRLTPLLEDPHPGADAVMSRLQRPKREERPKVDVDQDS